MDLCPDGEHIHSSDLPFVSRSRTRRGSGGERRRIGTGFSLGRVRGARFLGVCGCRQRLAEFAAITI